MADDPGGIGRAIRPLHLRMIFIVMFDSHN